MTQTVAFYIAVFVLQRTLFNIIITVPSRHSKVQCERIIIGTLNYFIVVMEFLGEVVGTKIKSRVKSIMLNNVNICNIFMFLFHKFNLIELLKQAL